MPQKTRTKGKLRYWCIFGEIDVTASVVDIFRKIAVKGKQLDFSSKASVVKFDKGTYS